MRTMNELQKEVNKIMDMVAEENKKGDKKDVMLIDALEESKEILLAEMREVSKRNEVI